MTTFAPQPTDAHVPTVAIVGAGFSGAVTAVQLLRFADAPLRVVLLNESGRMARGVAYGTCSAEHVLNVPAGNMSALADEPEDFLRYCRWAHARWDAGSFVPRRLYGTYLESLLSAAENGDHAAPIQLERVVARATHLSPPSVTGKACVHLDDGRSILADRVVLAFGNFAPAHPIGPSQRELLGDAYVADPWRHGMARLAAPDDTILLVGSGLTAVDLVVSLERAGHRGPLVALSRRGLAPQPHRARSARPTPLDVTPLLNRMGPSLRTQVRELRRELQAAAGRGEDWRDWIGALRPHTPGWWRALDDADRRRFLRHVQAHWDTLRHRCAPEAFDAFERRRHDGTLRLLGGRIVDIRRAGARFFVVVRPRGTEETRMVPCDRVVNCTGPSTRLDQCESALVRSLLDRGLVKPDAHGLGLQVGASLEVVDRAGCPLPWLRYIGPMLKARDWEGTAIPELRVHALSLARTLLSELTPLPAPLPA